jgi:hypothetical protein
VAPASSRGRQPLEGGDRAAPAGDLEHRPDQHAVHLAHERVGLDPELEHVAVAPPRGRHHVTLEAPVVGVGRREGGEVVRAAQRRRACLERPEVDRMRPPERAARLERRRRRPREHAVEVGAADGVVASAEAVRRLVGGDHGDGVGQQGVDRAQARERPLVGDHLAERVDAGVGPSRHHRRDVLAQDRAQRAAQLTLDRPLPRLLRPARERAAVVLQDQFRVRLTHLRQLR